MKNHYIIALVTSFFLLSSGTIKAQTDSVILITNQIVASDSSKIYSLELSDSMKTLVNEFLQVERIFMEKTCTCISNTRASRCGNECARDGAIITYFDQGRTSLDSNFIDISPIFEFNDIFENKKISLSKTLVKLESDQSTILAEKTGIDTNNLFYNYSYSSEDLSVVFQENLDKIKINKNDLIAIDIIRRILNNFIMNIK